MSFQLVLISGAVAAGKSSAAALLISSYGFRRVSSGDYLRGLAAERGIDSDRSSLQALGDRLDLDTDFAWLIDDVAAPMIDLGGAERWLVDAVRKRKQVQHFRRRFPDLVHVHFAAPEPILRQRYVDRLIATGAKSDDAASDYDRAILHQNEIEARSLSEIADIEFDTSKMSPEEIVAAIGGEIEESGAT